MNLPMVIEAYASRFSMESAQEIATHILETAKDGVKVKPEELQPAEAPKARQKMHSQKVRYHQVQLLAMAKLNLC